MKEDVRIRVHEVRQTTSGHDYVVFFDAHILMFPDDPSVEVRLVAANSPPLAYEEPLLAEAIEYIQKGIESVLHPRGVGAYAEVSNLVINEVDFREKKFTEFTIAYLEAALAPEEEEGPEIPELTGTVTIEEQVEILKKTQPEIWQDGAKGIIDEEIFPEFSEADIIDN